MSIEYWVVTVHSPDYPQERVANVKQLQAAIPPLRIFGGTNKDHWDDDGPGGARGVLRTLRTSGVAFNWTASRGQFAWWATYLRFLHYFHEQNHTNFAILLQDDAVVPEGFEHEMQQKVEHLSLDQLKQNHALGYAETGLLTLKTAVPSVIKTICSKTIDMPTDWFHNKQNNDLTDEEDMSHTITKDEVISSHSGLGGAREHVQIERPKTSQLASQFTPRSSEEQENSESTGHWFCK